MKKQYKSIDQLEQIEAIQVRDIGGFYSRWNDIHIGQSGDIKKTMEGNPKHSVRKRNFSHCEVYGAEIVLSKGFEATYGYDESIEMYVCDEHIYYADESYGKDLYFDEDKISRFTILENGMLLAITEDDELYRVEPNNITKLNITLEELK